MLTYQLHERTFKIDPEAILEFPSNVTIEIQLIPAVPFGGIPGKSRNAVADVEILVGFNLTTGRAYTQRRDQPLFNQLEAEADIYDTHIKIKGNKVQVESNCKNQQDLQDLISALYYAFPAVLNIYLPDAPTPITAKGSVGKVDFTWDYKSEEIIASTVVTSKETQETHIINSWRKIAQFSETKNRRLIGALHYFLVGCRLLAAGSNQFEFMSEALLNFSRSLQSLFGETRDEVRQELKKLGKYSNDEIETYFLTALFLRNEFDVAHVNLSILKKKELRVLHDYCQIAENAIRKLLKFVLEGIEKGEYTPPKDPKMALSKDKLKILNTIRKNLSKVIKK